jgi:hypothetical protein
MTPEQILMLAVFVLVPLLNLVVRLLRRHLAGQLPRETQPEAPDTPARVRTLPSGPSARRAEARAIPPRVPPPVAAARRSRRRPRVHLGSAREVRRGLVLMAVLGPCRGLEPPRLTPGAQPDP